jgi:hypothetical protein
VDGRVPAERGAIKDRMAARAESMGESADWVDCPMPGDRGFPRWRLSARWVEFECGCVAERCIPTYGAETFDPVIFRELPEQAVYLSVCHAHAPGMNVYVHFGGFADFDQWARYRRDTIMGRTQ